MVKDCIVCKGFHLLTDIVAFLKSTCRQAMDRVSTRLQLYRYGFKRKQESGSSYYSIGAVQDKKDGDEVPRSYLIGLCLEIEPARFSDALNKASERGRRERDGDRGFEMSDCGGHSILCAYR